MRTFFGLTFACKAAVLTTGTFMNGRIWVGRHSMEAGRAGEGASTGLTEALVGLGFETDRLKTGTPARVDSRTVDFSGLEEQPGVWCAGAGAGAGGGGWMLVCRCCLVCSSWCAARCVCCAC